MSNAPPRSPADWFAGIIRCLSMTLDGHSTWGKLPRPLALLILDTIRKINQRFRRIADRIAAGTYRPHRCPTRSPPVEKKPRRRSPLPTEFAWLIKLVQETAPFGSQLQALFRDPEMAALMAAAPGSLRRPLRSLCRMLGVAPPAILARPAEPKRPRPLPRPRIPREKPEPGFSPRRPMGRVRYVGGLRYPSPLPKSD